jgi:hypothetical protein
MKVRVEGEYSSFKYVDLQSLIFNSHFFEICDIYLQKKIQQCVGVVKPKPPLLGVPHPGVVIAAVQLYMEAILFTAR